MQASSSLVLPLVTTLKRLECTATTPFSNQSTAAQSAASQAGKQSCISFAYQSRVLLLLSKCCQAACLGAQQITVTCPPPPFAPSPGSIPQGVLLVMPWNFGRRWKAMIPDALVLSVVVLFAVNVAQRVRHITRKNSRHLWRLLYERTGLLLDVVVVLLQVLGKLFLLAPGLLHKSCYCRQCSCCCKQQKTQPETECITRSINAEFAWNRGSCSLNTGFTS